jgi:hypothetical protein
MLLTTVFCHEQDYFLDSVDCHMIFSNLTFWKLTVSIIRQHEVTHADLMESPNTWVHSSIQQVHLSMKLLLLLPYDGQVSKTSYLKQAHAIVQKRICLWLCYVCHYFNNMHLYLPPANGKTVLNGAKASKTELLPSL